MFLLDSPPRNLLSTRLPRVPVAHSFPDYLTGLRSGRPAGGKKGVYSPQRHTTDDLERSGFIDKLTAQLLEFLRLPTFSAETPLESVVAQYVADTATLADQVDATDALFARIADTQTLMFDPDEAVAFHLRSAFEGQTQRARARFAQTLFTPQGALRVLGSHCVTADFLATQRRGLLSVCQADLQRRSRSVAAYVMQCLADGVASGLLGIVAWPAEDTCWYARGEQRLKPKAPWQQNQYDHWRVCKEVHLMDATTLGGIPGWLELPPAVESVAGAIPPVLWPHLGTVVGTMIRQREFSWLVGTVGYPSEIPTLQREVVVDPAIVIGSIVLTGWELPHHWLPQWWMRFDRWLQRPRPAALPETQRA